MDDTAEDVISVILQKLPVKSLLRFKTVCKSWLQITSHPHFQALYRNVIIKPYNGAASKFPGQQLSLVSRSGSASLTYGEHTYFDLAKLKLPDALSFIFREPKFIEAYVATGTCSGVCLLKHWRGMLALWNHATREYRVLSQERCCFSSLSGLMFGEVLLESGVTDFVVLGGSIRRHPRIELYRLSTGKWKVLEQSNLLMEYVRPWITCFCIFSNVCINGVFYWLRQKKNFKFIVCFDWRTEICWLIDDIPEDVTKHSTYSQKLSCYTSEGQKFLAIVIKCVEEFELWVMRECGLGRSCWVKEESIKNNVIFRYSDIIDGRKEADDASRDIWFNAILYTESLVPLHD